MKALKKAISLVLCLCLIASFTVAAFAADGKKTDYPFIYVHGMYGWGEDAEKEITRPYWGTQPENNIIPYLRSLGVSFLLSLPALLLITARRTQRNAATAVTAAITQTDRQWARRGILKAR